MRFLVLWLGLLPPGTAASFTIHGTVLDPSGAAIAGAQVSVVNRLGVARQTTTDQAGGFTLKLAQAGDMHLAVTAPGFETKNIPLARTSGQEPLTVHLNIAPQVDSVRVAGSAIDVPLSEQGSSIAIVPREEIAERNEGLAVDLLRYLPGITVAQTGSAGAVADLFIRGGNYNFNLVQIDGVPVNSFGGAFDFAHIPTDWLDRVEVIEGAQSSVYGAYANSGVVNLVTRSAADSPPLEVLAEGGTYRENRFAVGGAGTLAGFGVAAFVSPWAGPARWRALEWPLSFRSLETTVRSPTATTAMTTWRCTLRARSPGKACRSAATTTPTTWEIPVLTVPIRGAISRDSTRSAATRTIFPTTFCITRSISRRASARRRSRVSSWKTAATPAPTDSVMRRICAASSRRAA